MYDMHTVKAIQENNRHLFRDSREYIYVINSREHPKSGGHPAWGLGEVLPTPCRIKNTTSRTTHNCLGLGPILWYTLSNKKRVTRLCGAGQGRVAGSCVCGNEPLGFIKCAVFLD